MDKEIKFNVALKKILKEGTLAWEYNPFRNYRLDEDMIFYKDQFYPILEFCNTFGSTKDQFSKVETNSDGDVILTYKESDKEGNKTLNLSGCSEWSDILGDNFDKTEEVPAVYQKGLLVDFITDEFDFDLNHPVQITPTYSYDNSVDLIINDGKSLPKIINSRFSAIGKNKYKIIDRTGNNDTNIYDKGTLFDIDTSLYKVTSLIPEVTFAGQSYGGNLKVGNYHFYFKYSDLDGNESDFVAQSGLVSVFLGNTPNSINSGFRDLNSNKKVRFILSNIDESYDYILVYYSRATSEEFQNRTTLYAKIAQKYKVSLYHSTIIDITGFEDTIDVSYEDINQRLLVYDSAKTQAISLNMLFLGNTTQSNLDHDYLSRLALYIIPSRANPVTCNIKSLTDTYKGSTANTYYDPSFIYKYTGYWDDEIYRFGVVFIRNNNTLTPVYNIRGLHLENDINKFDFKFDFDPLTNKILNLISYDETTFSIDADYLVSTTHSELENAKGVCYIPPLGKLIDVIGINFKCSPGIIDALQRVGIKGYFIVRLKRIPTTLCLAYTIGVEKSSHTPMLPTANKLYKYESFLNSTEEKFTFWNEDGRKKTDYGYLLSNIFTEHERTAPDGTVFPKAAICPDYDVNTAYLNTLFTGAQFTVNTYYSGLYLKSPFDRLYTVDIVDKSSAKETDVRIIGVEDNVKLVGIDDDLFSARAGEAEEAFRYAYVGNEMKTAGSSYKERSDDDDNTWHGGNNLIRGSFGPYLGITGYDSAGDLITIKIPGYNSANMLDYFKIRYSDASMFYPISDRLVFKSTEEFKKTEGSLYPLATCYRGDCYICKFTHRLNRNFRDADTPTNDAIVDPSTWAHNINFEDGVLKTDTLDKINLGDVNAVNLGMWVSFILRSDINHSVRSLNESNVDETALIGHSRGFYPYYPISASSAYKLPETGTYNKGFGASVGELIFEELPIVPYYKDVFSTRIAYSNLQITSAFKNAYRVFAATHYRDYPITYGEITKIIEWDGDLICVLEHGIYKIPINERAVAGEGSGGYVYINTSNVLPENPLVISDTFGSLWIDSIVKTPAGIYGVDTVAKKIWKVDKSGIEVISDFKVLEFLNKNITLTERELTPIIGIRNVKTHYNAFKHDVMFTFYDDLHGLDEVAWNLCWNESMNKWVTFYSWLPSFSENIYNSYFSFDRETSKEIALLALNEKSEQNDLIYLDRTVLEDDSEGKSIGILNYDLNKDGAQVTFKWEIVNDPYGNYLYFELAKATVDDKGKITSVSDKATAITTTSANDKVALCYKNDFPDYVIQKDTTIEYNGCTYSILNGEWVFPDIDENTKELRKDPKTGELLWKQADTFTSLDLSKKRDKRWKEKFETVKKNNNGLTQRKVYLLNIKVTPEVTYTGTDATYAEYIANHNANASLTGGYIERTIAVIPKDHLEALSTDFWKHGLAGIIDIKEEIMPTYWYGKQHPFEFEFIVRDTPDTHKIFDNLVIISNKAEPHSFHYEIVGECYDFAKDKKNMYIRQEATKELAQNSGFDVAYNSDYKELIELHTKINDRYFDKSTIFPAYYYRRDLINTVEDYYLLRPGENGKNFAYLSGSEIVRYKDLNEYRIWTHSLGVDVNQGEGNLLRGNMYYKEDKWYVLISPINYVLCNEPDWGSVLGDHANAKKIPIELRQTTFDKLSVISEDTKPLNERGYTFWTDEKIRLLEAKIKDKYIKIRIRYSGEDLAVISAIKTLYSISYA